MGKGDFFLYGEQIISIIKTIYFYDDVQLSQASKSARGRGLQSKIYSL